MYEYYVRDAVFLSRLKGHGSKLIHRLLSSTSTVVSKRLLLFCACSMLVGSGSVRAADKGPAAGQATSHTRSRSTIRVGKETVLAPSPIPTSTWSV